MAKTLFGELSIRIRGREYVLRPSFAALYEIEYKTGVAIPDLLTQPLTPARIRLILRQGMVGGKPRLPVMWRKYRFAATHFLRHGLGYLRGASLEAAAAPDWQALYQTATVTLGKTADAFWRMTMTEMMLECAALAEEFGLEAPLSGPPATSAQLDALRRRFPDAPA